MHGIGLIEQEDWTVIDKIYIYTHTYILIWGGRDLNELIGYGHQIKWNIKIVVFFF